MSESKHTPGYEVTREGRVYSVAHNWRGYGRRELRQDLNDDGYPSVRVTVDGKRTRYAVHRLVALHHLPPRPSPSHEVRHLDGNKLNPHAENLAWGTQKENADDRDRHGRTSRGERHSLAVRRGRSDSFSDAEIRCVTRLRSQGWTYRAIAERLGRSPSAISYVYHQGRTSRAKATGAQA